MNSILTVLKFEYMNYIKNKVFIVISIILCLIGFGATFIPSLIIVFNNKLLDSKETPVYFSDDSDFANYYMENSTGYKIVDTEQEGIDEIKKGDIQNFISFDGFSYKIYTNNKNLAGGENTNEIDKKIVDFRTKDYLLKKYSDEEVNQIYDTKYMSETVNLDGKNQDIMFYKASISYVMIMILYITVLMYGSQIAMSVAREKSTRTMELLITSTKAKNLIFGKVFGIGLAGITQLLFFCTTAAISMYASSLLILSNVKIDDVVGASATDGANTFALIIQNITVSNFLYLLLFFVLGFFLYAFIYGALASTVNRLEDVNSVISIGMILFVGAFLIALNSLNSPNSTLSVVSSYIPFFSPMVMFARVTMGVVGIYEVLISVGILIITIIGTAILAAKIYRAGVLMYGTTPKLKDIIKIAWKAEV